MKSTPFTLLLSSVAATILATPSVGQDAFSLDEITSHLQYKRSQLQELRQGKIISNDMSEWMDKQMGVSLAMLVRAPFERTVDWVFQGNHLISDEQVIEVYRLGGDPQAADLSAIEFDASEADEISRLLKARAGSTFNLSAAETDRFSRLGKRFKGRKAGDPEVRNAVNAEYRKMLFDRLAAYRRDGLNGIADYTRGGRRTASPRDELTLAIARETFLPNRMPDLYLSFMNYPRHENADIEHDFVCIKQTVEGRPCLVLLHRMTLRTPDLMLGMQRQFYVGHTYNSLQMIGGVFRQDEESIVVYTNRTSTDQVGGLGSGLKKGIGRGRVKSAVTSYFEKARRELEQPLH